MRVVDIIIITCSIIVFYVRQVFKVGTYPGNHGHKDTAFLQVNRDQVPILCCVQWRRRRLFRRVYREKCNTVRYVWGVWKGREEARRNEYDAYIYIWSTLLAIDTVRILLTSRIRFNWSDKKKGHNLLLRLCIPIFFTYLRLSNLYSNQQI